MDNRPGEAGAALIITLIALSLFSLLGLFMLLNAATGLQISDNYESQVQASYAALSGLSHARAALRGLSLDDLLKGPDGDCNRSASYMAQARTFGFRNLLTLTAAQSLNVDDPSSTLAGLPDDGLINAGYFEGVSGIILIPLSGIAQMAPNPYGPGKIVTSRYFVKITDNNGEAAEIAGDPNNDPFFDGDGVLIVRSMGVARTFSDFTGAIRRSNSVEVFEARMKCYYTFDLGPAVVLQGIQLSPSFDGAYEISGGEFPAIGTIDADVHDSVFPDQTIRMAPLSSGIVQGGNLPRPSVQDISGLTSSSPEKSLLLQPEHLWKLTRVRAPRFADLSFIGEQSWSDSSAPYLGSYDISKPSNAPGQNPKIVVVNGNLQLAGNISGGGLLIVTGDLYCSGSFIYNGLILVVGSGRLFVSGSGSNNIEGGVYVSNLSNSGSDIKFGTTVFSISGTSRIVADREAVRMALRLIPASQIGFREISGSDP
jgi:hypothetical protein